MTPSVKTIVAAAALIAANVAHAEWQFVSGTANLAVFDEAYMAMDASNAFFTTYGLTNKAQYDDYYVSPHLTLEFTAGTVVGNEVKTLSSIGSELFLWRTVVVKGTTVVDSRLSLSDFVFDMDARTLSAHVSGGNLLIGEDIDYGWRTIYSADAFSGGDIVAGTANGHTEGALTMSADMVDIYLTALGLPQNSAVADRVRTADWGTFSITSTFQATVPEPSAYLSLLAWLAVLGAAHRARRHTI